jgi:HD superfamily phosphodiesterase
MIPSAEKCFELMEKYGMPDNIKAHSIVVEKIAFIIARGNIDAGFDISIEKVIAGSLMHDIGRTSALIPRMTMPLKVWRFVSRIIFLKSPTS